MKIEKFDTFSGHSDCVYTVVVGEKSNIFYSSGADGQVVRWNLEKPDAGELIARIPASVYAMAFHKESNLLWVCQNGEGIHRIDPLTKTEHSSLKITFSSIFDIQFYQNLAWVASSDGIIFVIDIEKFALLKTIKASEKSARTIAINSKSNELAVGFSDFSIKIFDLTDFSQKFIINAHKNSVFTLKYSPDFLYLISGSRDAHLKKWNVVENYQLELDIPAHMYAINDLYFSPNGNLMATCSMDKSIKIWEPENLKLLKVLDKARHAGHGTSINKLLWTGFDNLLVSASDDRKISVWKIIEE
ncbi:MAG: WD40 repeat domain-containing protein [Bacteroidota bacterium]